MNHRVSVGEAEEFFDRVHKRLFEGAKEHSDTLQRPLNDIAGELLEETEGIAGWGLMLWVKIRRMRDRLGSIAVARRAYRDAFRADKSFRGGYVANVAMLLSDRQPEGGWDFRDHETRNAVADQIVHLVFESRYGTDEGAMTEQAEE